MQEYYTIRTKDTKQWYSILERLPAGMKSVYNTPEYLRIFEKIFGFQGELFCYRNDENGEYVAYPYLVRGFDSLENLAETDRRSVSDSRYRDIVSSWYYGGAIGRIGKDFFPAFHGYCREHGIVTEFARLNPYTVDHRNYPGAEYNRDVVWVDLLDPTANHERKYRKAIRKAERDGVEVFPIHDDMNGIKEFANMYNDDMEEKNASPFYRFPYEFFKTLFESMDDHVTLFAAFSGGTMIAGTVLLHRFGKVNDYLRGSMREHLELRPNNLLIHTQIEWARKKGYLIYDLGGGLRRQRDDQVDNLFVFKRNFSDLTKPFYVWKKIHDEYEYSNLVEMRRKNGGPISKKDYFPVYREGIGEMG